MKKTLKHKEIDSLDHKILAELQKNARITNAEIGRRVGLSAPAVGDRITKLEEHGYIEGYRTVLNMETAWLAAPEDLRAATREALAAEARRRYGWEGVARGVIAAAEGNLAGLPPVPGDRITAS